MNVNEAYDACEQIIQQNSATFYQAFKLLKRDERRAVYAVYAFCRIVDDIVDEGSNVEVELQQFQSEFQAFLAGNYNHFEPHWVALADVFKRYPMDAQAFQDMIHGQTMDLTIHRYETLADLERYCYHVATTVGLMLLPILVPNVTPALIANAHDLGYALQLTNILRDVAEDYERGRIYLPQQWLKEFGVTEAMLAGPTPTPEFVKLWEAVAQVAQAHYAKANQFAKYYPVRSRIAVFGAAKLYAAILTKIRQHHYDVFSCKQYVDDAEKQRLIAELQESQAVE